MTGNLSDFHTLKKLLGTHVKYHGLKYEVIEVLDDGPMLVLQDAEMHTSIQPDQHGEAHRRVPQVITVPIHSSESEVIAPEDIGLELLD
ncbi:MAG: hypothetical protein ACE5EH_03730 [Gammaproteobacteria bacterium]